MSVTRIAASARSIVATAAYPVSVRCGKDAMGGETMRVDWQGVFPALMTEFKEEGALDLASTQRHARACLDAGCSGLIMLGTLGENSSLSPEEKETVLRAAVEAAEGRAPVVAGVAEYTTEL